MRSVNEFLGHPAVDARHRDGESGSQNEIVAIEDKVDVRVHRQMGWEVDLPPARSEFDCAT